MQFPKLSPLQSRFAASLTATIILFLVYLSLTRPQFAYALDLDSRIPPDHNHPIVFEVDKEDVGFEDEQVSTSAFEERAVEEQLALSNNQPQNKNINAGQIQYWKFTKEAIDGPPGEPGKGLPAEDKEVVAKQNARSELRRRQSVKQVYVTVNTCLQPSSNTTSNNLDALVPPQLLLYYSQSESNLNPGPLSNGDQQNSTFDGGYAIVNITTDSDVYIGIAAPTMSNFVGSWNYEIAASIDAPYHSVEEDVPNLHFVDGDFHAALLITDALTSALPNSTVYQEWMNLPPPYGMLGNDQREPSILGVQKSYCGLMHNAQIITNLQNVDNQNVASITNRGLGGQPKEQFYVTSLNASSNYWGFLAMQGNSTASGLSVVGGGGKVWPAINFTTKAESNCALMYNLTFCSEVAYAVPTNPDLFSPRGGLPELARLYDDNAQAFYQNFNYSLQQIPCNTTSSAQYSLARTCDDCARAYKQWLCAVTIPRCEDFTNTATYLKPRNVAQPFPNGTRLSPDQLGPNQVMLGLVASNQSRNALIDDQIKPGPYKEVLPCEDLCYDLVQSCPAALGFGCPLPRAGLEDSYGFRTSDASEITCSYLGAAYYLSAASGNLRPTMMGLGLTILLMTLTWH